MKKLLSQLSALLLPLVGIAALLALWTLLSTTVCKGSPDENGALTGGLPSPIQAWQDSKLYILEPFAKRGEQDRGILAYAWLSLLLVMKGYAIALIVGTPLGFLMGISSLFRRAFDPVFQILRPVSPLAWLPLGYVLFASCGKQTSEFAALFTVALCAMWPTVINTAAGVRSIPQDYHNVAKVLRLSKVQTLVKILLPAAMPQMFTGYRLSLGIAWLVIVAVEMLTGRAGIGGFLWDAYQSQHYSHFILCILTIGVIGFAMDRLMNLAEARVTLLFSIPGRISRALDAVGTLIARRSASQIARHKEPKKAKIKKESTHVLS